MANLIEKLKKPDLPSIFVIDEAHALRRGKDQKWFFLTIIGSFRTSM